MTSSSSAARTCAVCQSATSLRKCSRCQNAEYCSSTCQRSDWPSHKASCQKTSVWYDAERRCEDGSKHEGRLELITWETSAADAEGEAMGWGNCLAGEDSELLKKKFYDEFKGNEAEMYEYWPRGFRWTCCGTEGEMKYGCDHHGKGKKPCTCDFCRMGKPLPDGIFNSLSRSAAAAIPLHKETTDVKSIKLLAFEQRNERHARAWDHEGTRVFSTTYMTAATSDGAICMHRTDEEGDEPPPDGGYGWVCVAACFMINCFTWGIVASYGVYLSYYLRLNSFPGSDPLVFAFVGGSNFGAAMLVAPLVTFLARKYGTRAPMFAGVLALAGGFISASYASKGWHLLLSQGALVGVGVGFIYIPSIAILSQWFSKKRSLANGITAAGSGVGGIMFSLITGSMIESISLAWSLRITGIIALVMTFTAVVLIKDRNTVIQPAQHPFETKLLARHDVWLLLMWAFISMLGYITLLYSLPDFAISIGLSRAQSTDVITFLNLGTAVGRPFIGGLSDRYGRIKVAALLTLACGISCFAIWLPANSFGVTVLFALISGAILGVFWVASISPILPLSGGKLTARRPLDRYVLRLLDYNSCHRYYHYLG